MGHLTPIREPEALANVLAIKLEISRERSTACAALQQPGWVLGGRGEGAIGREDPISALHLPAVVARLGHASAGPPSRDSLFPPTTLHFHKL